MDGMIWKVIYLIYLIALVFTFTDAEEVTTDDEDNDEASGGEMGGNGFISMIGAVTTPNEVAKDPYFYSDDGYSEYPALDYLPGGSLDDDCAAFRMLDIFCPLSEPGNTTPTYQSTSSETDTTNSISLTITPKFTSTDAIESTAKVGETTTKLDVIHLTGSANGSRSRSALVATNAYSNAITEPAKRQPTAKIDTTTFTLLAKRSDALQSTETKRSATTASSYLTTHAAKPENSQQSTESSGIIQSLASTKAITKTTITPLMTVADDAQSTLAVKKATAESTINPDDDISANPQREEGGETHTAPLLIIPHNAHSTSTAEKARELSTPSATISEKTTELTTTSLLIASNGFDLEARYGLNGDDTEPIVTSGSPVRHGNKDFNINGYDMSTTTGIVITENRPRPQSRNGNVAVLNPTSAETTTVRRFIPTSDVVMSINTSQNPTKPSAKSHATSPHVRTDPPDFDIKTGKILSTPQHKRTPPRSPATTTTNTTDTVSRATLLDVILTVTSRSPEGTSRKTSQETEILFASTAFPTTVVILCVVAAIIALIIIVVLIVILRGRMNKSGKYNITSEMNSMVGDEAGVSGHAKVVKVHYNGTDA